MAAFARTELDLVGLAREDNQAAVTLFIIRDGKMIGRDVYLLDAAREASDTEVLTSFLEQYYTRATSIPREIYVPAAITEADELQTFLVEKRGGPVHLRTPQRGEKRDLLGLAERNAAETLQREHARWLADQGKTLAALEELAAALDVPGIPFRIECYDISNFQGSESVGSMVVFEDGKPRTGEYRRFRIRTVEGPNDVASHQEVLRRRFRATKSGEEGNEEERRWAMPDLVIVDGGKPQVNAAKVVLDELGLHDLPLAGLAKEREELFLPGRSDPVVLPATSSALYLVQRLRDEAHRFAITYHRTLRDRRTVTLGVRRPAGSRPQAQARAAEGVRVDQARARGAGRADRGGTGHQPGAGRADQGDPGGVARRTRSDPLRRSTDASDRVRGAFRVASRRMRRAGPFLIAVIGILSLIVVFFPNLKIPDPTAPDGAWRTSRPSSASTSRAGCGSSTRPSPRMVSQPTREALGVLKDIIERRVNATGVSEPVVVVQGDDRVVIELPGISDVDSVRRLVGQTGVLDFVPLGQTTATEGQVLDLTAVPAAVQRRPARVRGRRSGPDARPDGHVQAQGQRSGVRSAAVRELHARPCQRLLRDRPRRFGHHGATDRRGHPERSGPDHGRRDRRLPGEGGQHARHDPEVRLAAVPGQGAVERTDLGDAR